MNRNEAVVVAAAAAEAAFRNVGRGRRGWYWRLSAGLAIEDLARFVERHPGASSEDLFHFASGGAAFDPTWDGDVAVAVAVETFDATLRKMLSRVERDAACPSSASGD
ncbi:MAG TPA: hypothetical protein PK857_00510 [Hyphomicrobium sp.]|nr:hypothetical protein [Hyphomicrobium sp.]HRO48778.1 hypothetical protein [Hyphomicrobium sp.]